MTLTTPCSTHLKFSVRLLSTASVLACALLLTPSVTQAQATKPPANATAVPRSKWVTSPITFGKPERYRNETDWFEAQIPANWKKKDSSTATTAIVSFTDPTENGGVQFAVFGSNGELAKQQMADNLDAYIRKAFDHYPKFATGTGKPLKTMNGAGQGFSYRQNLANNQTVTMYGDAFYEQHGGKLISIIVLLLPEEQYATVKDKAYEIVNSFTALPENYIPDGALDGDTAKPEANTSDTSNQSAFTIGDLTDYADASGKYQLRVPDAWTRVSGVSNKTPFVTWADEASQGLITVVAIPAPTAFTGAELRTAATAFIKSYADKSKISNLVVGTTHTIDKSSASADFTFESEINGQSVSQSATVLVRQAGKSAVFLLVTVPSAELDANRDAINEILDSLVVSGSK